MEMGALDVPVMPSGARDLEARAARRTASAATRPARSLDRKVGMAMQSYVYGTPKDVAETVHFLCTGGSYVTGQIVRLDGGRSIT